MQKKDLRTDVPSGARDRLTGAGMALVSQDDAVRYTPKGAGRVVHLVGEDGPARRAAKCGVTKGLAWPREPSDVTLIVDRFCSRCWNRWAKERADASN